MNIVYPFWIFYVFRSIRLRLQVRLLKKYDYLKYNFLLYNNYNVLKINYDCKWMTNYDCDDVV